MSRAATVKGTTRRVKLLRTTIRNLERDLHAVGERDIEFTQFDPDNDEDKEEPQAEE